MVFIKAWPYSDDIKKEKQKLLHQLLQEEEGDLMPVLVGLTFNNLYGETFIRS